MALIARLVPSTHKLLLLMIAIGHSAVAYQIETIAEGLAFPYGMAFLPGDEMLVTERAGRLRLIKNGRLQPEPVSGVPPVFTENHAGLLDIVPHPQFAANRRVYFSLVQGSRAANTTLVFRAEYADGKLTNVTRIYRAAPAKRTAIAFGGRLAFLPDGTLLISIGDGFLYREQAQDLASSLGKIVRIADDGRIPPDNPFFGKAGVRQEIWSYGHRCILGLIHDPVAGVVYAHENGPKGGDEINLIGPGRNYGWPIATYGMDYSGAYVSPFRSYPGTEQPLMQWPALSVPRNGRVSLAPSGLAQCRRCQWPEWEGDLFVGMLGGMQVRRVRIREGRIVEQATLLEELNERIRDVRFGPDGALYVSTDSPRGRVLRIRPD